MNSLDQSLFDIGIQLNIPYRKLKSWVDIEKTILQALLQARDDRKIFSLILSWADTYGDRLIAEKLIKIYKKMDIKADQEVWFRMFFIYMFDSGHRSFKNLALEYPIKTLARRDYATALKLKGAHSIFEKYNILIPESFINISKKNISPIEVLFKRNFILKNRYLFGANWRSDIISAIQMGMQNPFQIKNTIGCSYDAAYRTFKDYKLVAP